MIYDDPNHPHYGPVRRLHIMVMQLFDPSELAFAEQQFERAIGRNWTEALSDLIDKGNREAVSQRTILKKLITGKFTED